jgi:hypothetical protein
MMKLAEIETRSKKRWTAGALQRIIKEGRWTEVTGRPETDVEKRPRVIFVRAAAGEHLIDVAARYTLSLEALAKRMGLDPLTLRTANYVDYRRVGRMWFTTPAEGERALSEKKVKDGSHSPEEFGALCNRDKSTVNRWIRSGVLPKGAIVQYGVFNRIDKGWAARNAHLLRPEVAGRFVNPGWQGRATGATRNATKPATPRAPTPREVKLLELGEELRRSRVGHNHGGERPRPEGEILAEMARLQEPLLAETKGRRRWR